MTSYNGGRSTNHNGNNYNYPDYHQHPSNQNPPPTNQYRPPNNNQNQTHHHDQYVPPHNYIQYARPHHNPHPPSTHITSNRAHLVNRMNRPHQYHPSHPYVYPNQLNTSVPITTQFHGNHVRSRNANIVLPHSGSRRKKSRVFCNSNKYQQTGKEMREWIREKHRRHNHNNTIGINTNNNTNSIMYDNINGFGNIIDNGVGNIIDNGVGNNQHSFRELLDKLQNKDNNNNNSINNHNKSLPFTFDNSESCVNKQMPLSALYDPNEQYIRQTVHHMDNAYKQMINNIHNNNINESENVNNWNRNETNQSSLILTENDNFRYKTIYKILVTTCSELPNSICKNIAEFSIGDIKMCMNDKCNNEILIYGFSEKNYFINNGNININNNPLIIDVNKQPVIFCAGCKNSIVQCEFKIEKKNEIYFDKLWCSNMFIWNGIHNTCSPCRLGRILSINGGIQVAVKVENNISLYSILSENKWGNNNYGGYHNK